MYVYFIKLNKNIINENVYWYSYCFGFSIGCISLLVFRLYLGSF